jgi:hypothetical protein
MANESFKRKFHTTRPPKDPNELKRTIQTWCMDNSDAMTFSDRSRNYRRSTEMSQMAEGTRRVQMGDDALAMEKQRRFPRQPRIPGSRRTRDKALANYDHNNPRTCRLLKIPSITKAHFTGLDRPLFEEDQQYAPSDNSYARRRIQAMLVAISVPFTTFEDTALPPVTRAACPQSIPIFMPPP